MESLTTRWQPDGSPAVRRPRPQNPTPGVWRSRGFLASWAYLLTLPIAPPCPIEVPRQRQQEHHDMHYLAKYRTRAEHIGRKRRRTARRGGGQHDRDGIFTEAPCARRHAPNYRLLRQREIPEVVASSVIRFRVSGFPLR
jgi:hypothetical protein